MSAQPDANSHKGFEAWCYPTELNKHSVPRKIGGLYTNIEDARDAIYFDRLDESAPDKDEYYTWSVVPV